MESSQPSTSNLAAPRVFVSYSWTNPDYQQRVIELCTRLRSDGVDIVLDKWDLREGHDAHAFMERLVTDQTIQKVLILSDSEYAKRANAREKGVGAETQIVSKDVYGRVEQTKFIPVVMERSLAGEACLPAYLGSRVYIDFSTEQLYITNYEQLLRAIHDKPLFQKPLLGSAPAYLDTAPSIGLRLDPLVTEYHSFLLRGNTTGADLLFQEILDRLLSTLNDLVVTQIPNGKYLDELVRERIHEFLASRNAYISALLHFGAVSGDDANRYAIVHAFLESAIRLLKPDDSRDDAVCVAVFELLLYTIAVLAKQQRFAPLRLLMDEPYLSERNGDWVSNGLGANNFYARSLEHDWNRREQRRRISVLADLVKERASHPKLTFVDLAQAELVLFVHAALHHEHWYPRLLIYTERIGGMELFVRATTQARRGELFRVLGADSQDDLLHKLSPVVRRFRGAAGFWDFGRQLEMHMDLPKGSLSRDA
jgi:hypothetical protein